jgi:excisionase family DNA binding protein
MSGDSQGNPRSPTPEVMTIDDLAANLQVSKSSLYKLAQDGRVPGQKVGRHWRFLRTTIDRWLGDDIDPRPDRTEGDK